MTIGALPQNMGSAVHTEFSIAYPYTFANSTVRAKGSFGLPYSLSSWVGKSNASFTVAAAFGNGDGNDYYGFAATGFGPLGNPVGSCSPTTFNGIAINTAYSLFITGGAFQFFNFNLQQGALGKGYFTSLTINGTTYLSSASSYNDNGTNSNWFWTTPNPGLGAGNNYPVLIT